MFNKAFHSSPAAKTITKVSDATFVDINDSYESLLGYTRDELLGHKTTEFNIYIYPQQRDEIIRLMREQGTVRNQELVFRKKNGQLIHTLCSLEQINIKGQEYFLSALIDITERKQTEAEIIHLASFPELNPNPIIEMDTSGIIKYLNPAAITAFPDLNEKGLKHPLLAGLEGFKERKEPNLVISDIRIGDFWFEQSVAWSPSTQTYRIYCRDISERRRAEEALRESELRLRLAQDAAKAGSWEWDLTTNENIWSDELWKVYGIKPYSVKPSYEVWLQTIHPDDREIASRAVQEAVAKGGELSAEWRVIDQDGTQRWVMSRGRPIFDAGGKPIRYSGIVLDVTERKRAEEELKESEERYRTLFETMTEGFAHCRILYQDDKPVDWVYLDVNPAFEKITGLKGAEGKNVSDLIPGVRKSNPELFETYGRVAGGGSAGTFRDICPGARHLAFSLGIQPQERTFCCNISGYH